ncbi:hypothetical protein [Aliiglaciecola sp. NS0011-25]|uniref:hypothetical protein n=1 Tax=Aliiglaciecola sp. NS0011-25 TaxID=3127654 RepID=UPI00310C3692
MNSAIQKSNDINRMYNLKIIITTGSLEPWCKLTGSFDGQNVSSIESYGGLKSSTKSELLLCKHPIEDFEAFLSDLNNNNFESIILFYQQCEFAVANAISQGETLESAASDWLEKNTALLKFQKQNRRKVRLINLEQSLLNPTALNNHMDENGVSIQCSLEYQVESDLNLLLACQYVRQEKSLSDLNTLLTACSLPVSESDTVTVDNSLVLQQIIEQNASANNSEKQLEFLNVKVAKQEQNNISLHEKLECERETVSILKLELENEKASASKQAEIFGGESELLKLKLASLQEDLEHYHLLRETEKQKYAVSELELNEQLRSTSAKLENVKSESELLELQVASMQEELESIFCDLETEKQKKADIEVTLSKKLIKNEENFKSVKSEKELLDLQLAQVQEELEEYFLNNQTKDSQIVDLKNELTTLKKVVESLKTQNSVLNSTVTHKNNEVKKVLQQTKVKQIEIGKLTSQLTKAKGEIEILNHNLNQVNAELAQIKASKIWKSVEPMRKLAKAVGRIDKKKAKLQQDIGLLLTSEYFDAKWYLETYPDVAGSEINPAEHYLKFGAKEGRFPSPQFDGKWYLQRYPDIADADINPLIHFIKFGIAEGRKASPTLLVNQSKFK